MTVARAQVRSITDGDTFRATIFVPGAFGTQVVLDDPIGGWPIRLLGVDTPEKQPDHAAWAAATAFTAEHLHIGDWVTLYSPDPGKTDSFRRVLAAVETAAGKDLGQLLLDAEHAVPWSRSRAADFGFDRTEWDNHTDLRSWLARRSVPAPSIPVLPSTARDVLQVRLRFALAHGDRMAEVLARSSAAIEAEQLTFQWRMWREGHGG